MVAHFRALIYSTVVYSCCFAYSVPPRISNSYAGNTCITYFVHKLQLMYVFVHKLQLNIIYSLCHKYVHKLQLMYKVPHTRIFCIRLLILGGTEKTKYGVPQISSCETVDLIHHEFRSIWEHVQHFQHNFQCKVLELASKSSPQSWALFNVQKKSKAATSKSRSCIVMESRPMKFPSNSNKNEITFLRGDSCIMHWMHHHMDYEKLIFGW